MARLRVDVQRTCEYYVYNVFCLFALIGSAAFSSWPVPRDEVADRISILLTIQLTFVATKFLIDDKLPKVRYTTVVGGYINAVILFNALFIFSVSASGVVDSASADFSAYVALSLLWATLHLWLLRKHWRAARDFSRQDVVLRAGESWEVDSPWLDQ